MLGNIGNAGALALLQLEGGPHMTLLIVFVGIIAFALLLQSAVIVGIAIAGLKAQKEVSRYLGELHGKAMPLIAQSHALVNDVTPQVKMVAARVESISASLAEITLLAKEKAHEFAPTLSAANETVLEANETVREANRKAAAQVARVNGMVSTALDATAQLGATIHHGIKVPAQEVAGVVTGVKAAIDTFLGGARALGQGSRRGAYRQGGMPAASSQRRLVVDKDDLGL